MNYWTSYQPSAGFNDRSPHFRERTCTVSVVLDAGSHLAFSKIRVLIVHKTDLQIKDVLIQPWHEYAAEAKHLVDWSSRSLHSKPEYGARLKSHRNRELEHRRATNNHHMLPPDTFTAVFELVECPAKTCYLLAPFKTHTCWEIPSSWAIGYDYSCPRNSGNPSVVLSLQINPPTDSYRCPGCSRRIIPAHEIRVLPATRFSRGFTSLPSHIIREIVSLCIDYEPGWRRDLLSYALVQKQWLHVIDLYFENVGTEGPGIYTPGLMAHPVKVARSLRFQPERGTLIPTFDYRWVSYFATHEKGSCSLEELRSACEEILHAGASSIRVLVLNKAWFHALRNTLLSLQKVESFTLMSTLMERQCPELYPAANQGVDPNQPGISDIQEVCKDWKSLERLCLREWGPERSESNMMIEIPAISGRLNDLQLSCGVINGRYLCSFTKETLETLNLDSVSGISNSDLLGCLLIISATVNTINIRDCKIERSPEEERAIEAALPHMERLQDLTLTGGSYSSAIISQRKVHKPQGFTPFNPKRAHGRVTLDRTDPMPFNELAEAMEVTAWSWVTVYPDPSSIGLWSWDQEAVDLAKKVAVERGISFVIY